MFLWSCCAAQNATGFNLVEARKTKTRWSYWVQLSSEGIDIHCINLAFLSKARREKSDNSQITYLMRCIAGKSIRNLRKRDIVVLQVCKSFQQNIRCNSERLFYKQALALNCSSSKQTSRFNWTLTKYGGFTGSVISKSRTRNARSWWWRKLMKPLQKTSEMTRTFWKSWLCKSILFAFMYRLVKEASLAIFSLLYHQAGAKLHL